MSSPAHLRPAEVNDLPFIFSKEREYMETIEPEALLGWMAALELNLADWIDCLPRTVFSVDDSGKPLGYAMWTLKDDCATLASIHVLGGRRRQGIGRLLLEAFEQEAAARGVRVLKLGVHRNNPARLLYEAAGYQPAGRDGGYLLFSRVPAES